MPICGEKSTIYSTQAEISHGLFHFAIVLAASQDVSIVSQDHAIAFETRRRLDRRTMRRRRSRAVGAYAAFGKRCSA